MLPDNLIVANLRREFETELFGHVLPFWRRYSPDTKHGGYYNCLDRDGTVYDTTKNIWLLARQVWMFSKLYVSVEPRAEWLDLARQGITFLQEHAHRQDNRVWFSLTESGQPLYLQRKMFSECFYTIALAQYAKAAGDSGLNVQVSSMYDTIRELAFTPGAAGRPVMAADNIAGTLAVPMILLNVIEELAGDDHTPWRGDIDDCITAVKKHVIDDMLYENITKNGDQTTTAAARLWNPGHAIEAGWFLQHWAIKLDDAELIDLSVRITRRAFDLGWDDQHQGLFYFLDAEGHSPTQLEWDMKLWWPHCEAMYAFLLNYVTTRQEQDWRRFLQVKDYTFSHFPDHEYGEWYGYLDRRGEVTHRFKGGPYKGCFHVPRSLLYCLKLLTQLEKEYE